MCTQVQNLDGARDSQPKCALIGRSRRTVPKLLKFREMRPGVSTMSLANRIIVVSRKPHGRLTNRVRAIKHCTLPAASGHTVRDAVDFLLTLSWPQSFLCQSVGSLAASQNLGHVSHPQLARLCELVSVEAGDGERGEGEEEGGERVGGGTREEEVSRVACLSALVPCLSADPSLHHIARAALCEVVVRRGGLSPELERSLLLVCGEDHHQLLQLAQLARSHGHRFSRSFYRGALSKVLQPPGAPPTTAAGGELGTGDQRRQEMPAVAGELMAMMSGDWEKAVVEAEVFWLALHLASEGSQVQAIWDDMNASQFVADESVSVELVRACLRTAGRLRHGNPNHCLPDPSQAVSALVSRLPARQASVSASAFEGALTACADTLQLRLALETFSCLTQVRGLAPTRASLQGLGRLLCAPGLTANRHWRRFRLAFASRMLDASVAAFGGLAPGWVFSECSRPLTELLGVRGYLLMYKLCQTAVVRDHGERNAEKVMEGVWGRGLYHALLQSCRVNHGPQLATFLLSHMTHRGIPPNERTFRHLLKFRLSPSDVDHYVFVLARHMHHLSAEEMAGLVQPLQTLLQSTLPPTRGECGAVIGQTVSQLLEVVSAGSSSASEQQCISQLASLSGVSLPSSLETENNSLHLSTSHSLNGNRATA